MKLILTLRDCFGQESNYGIIHIHYSSDIEAYIVEAIAKTKSSDDMLQLFTCRVYKENNQAHALAAALRSAETLADISTL